MTRLILDTLTLTKLYHLSRSLELCDPSGRTLGYFTPADDKSMYEGVEPPISEEELNQREQEGGGRTLNEILADLEQQA